MSILLLTGDGEHGDSVRGKLNAAIAVANELLTNPITYTGDPSFLRMNVTNQMMFVSDRVIIGPVVTFIQGQVDGLTSLDFGSAKAVTSASGGTWLSSTNLASLDLGEVVLMDGSLGASTFSSLTALTAENLVTVAGNWAWNMPALETLSLPVLKSAEISIVANALTTLDLPVYEDDFGNGMDMTANSLVSLNLPAIIRFGFHVQITAANLVSFSFGPGLKSIGDAVLIAGAALSQASVDGILVSLAALDGTNGTTSYDNHTIDLSGGTSAAPSATGLAAKAALEGRGNTVTTN